MSIYLILSVLFIHWIADFVFQTDKQAKGKSTSWECLLEHTFVYTCIWLLPAIAYCDAYRIFPAQCALFIAATFLCHTATDFYTSRVNSKLLEEGNTHGFFVSVGFDQLLHYAQLLLTIKYLT